MLIDEIGCGNHEIEDQMTTIYHMANGADWQAAQADGFYYGTPMDKADGFMHFSTGETVAESAAKHRKGAHGLVLLCVTAENFGEDIKWEPARGGILFPHLFTPLDVRKVDKAVPLPLDENGVHIFPE